MRLPKTMPLKTRLTLRYVGALTLVALVLIGAWFILQQQLSRNTQDAWLINTAGQQRMLSQRIALLSDELTVADEADSRARVVTALTGAIAQMRRNHEALTGPRGAFARTADIQAFYDGPEGLDRQVRDFVEIAERFLAAFLQNGASAQHPDRLIEVAAHELLQPLDDMVTRYQSDSEWKLARFRNLETAVVLVGLIVLMCEALLIFRPMVQHIDTTVQSIEAVNNELREFSFRISHDLRAPVASATGMVTIARDALDDDDKASAHYTLGRVEKAMLGLDRLISDIIAVARRDESTAPELVDLRALVDEVLARLSSMPGAGRVAMNVSVEATAPVMTHRVELNQILENLVSNAIKYTAADSPRVDIAVREHRGVVRVEVRDNGRGIEPEHRADLFGMFKRFHRDLAPGTGLGLYLSRRLARALGGDLEYSPLARGSAFSVTLPAGGAA
ncbi:MAG: ATP-binding protein [Pseudomonadota bacterium]